LGIVGFVDVPIVYLSSYWWRTLHPQPVIGPLAADQPSASITWLLMVSLVAFTVLFAFLVRVRTEIEALSDESVRVEVLAAGAAAS
jgi:heme exporter protein C